MSAYLPMAVAKDDMFPRIFKKENKKGAPIFGVLIGSVLTSIILLFNISDGLVDQFTFIVNLTVLACLVPYLFVSASYVIVLIEKKLYVNNFLKTFVLGSLGSAYSLWAIYGSGSDTVYYGFLLLLLSIPFYLMMKWNQGKN